MPPKYRESICRGCSGCPEREKPYTRWVGGSGPQKARLFIIGEAPGETEALTGQPFIGPSGQLLDATLTQYGIVRSEVRVSNSVMCPIKPKSDHLNACWSRLKAEIAECNPELVLTLGKIAFQQVCQTKTGLADTEGTLWWSAELKRWIIPTWHPAAALRGGADDRFFPAIANTIWRVARFLDGRDQLPDPNETRKVPWTFFRTPEGAQRAIRYYRRRASEKGRVVIAVDTESHTLKSPWEQGLEAAGKVTAATRKLIKQPKRPHPERDTWLMLQLYDGTRACAIDMTVQTAETLDAIREMLLDDKIIWAGHNIATYDTRIFRHNLGVCMPDANIRDTLILGLGLSERKTAVGLEPLSRVWLNAPAYKKGLKDAGYSHYKGPQSDAQWRQLAVYGVDDVYNGRRLNQKLPSLVRDEGTMDLVKNVLMPLALTCGRIAHRGLPVDTSQFDKLQEFWGGKTQEYSDKLHELAVRSGFPHSSNEQVSRIFKKTGRFNPASHPQLAHLAYDVLGLTPTDGTTNRKFTSKWDGGRSERAVDSDFLIGHEDTEFAQLMQVYRIYSKLYRTYVLGLLREIDPDGLIHPDFNIAGTSTGRLVVKPLLQVLPHYGAHRLLADEDFAAETRRLFPARPGYLVAAFDFKQLEMRVAAALSGDQQLRKTLEASDPHAVTARYMFRREEVDDADRHAAKRVTFGVMYNRSAFTLCRGPLLDVLGGTEVPEAIRFRKAQEFIDAFWRVYPDYYAWQQDCMRRAVADGELATSFGRKRRWPLITHQNKREIENQACNFPIQSVASDMCSMALVNSEPALEGIGWPLYTVHDQVVTEIREDKIEEGVARMREVMTTPLFETHGVKFDVTVEVGPNLGDVKKWAA